jgi:hypothetical protein
MKMQCIIKQLLISVIVICQIIKVSVKPVFHLRIFSREAIISFVFIQLVNWKTGLTVIIREVKIPRFRFTGTGDIHVPVPVNQGTTCNLRNPRYSAEKTNERMVTFTVEVRHRLLKTLTSIYVHYIFG